MDHTAVISADRQGLLSLSEQLKTLAEEQPGSHIHYDSFNSLEDGSDELIIEKIEPVQTQSSIPGGKTAA